MIDCAYKHCILFERNRGFTSQFSMQLAVIPKHSWTPKVQPAASGRDSLYKLQLSGFTLDPQLQSVHIGFGHKWKTLILY